MTCIVFLIQRRHMEHSHRSLLAARVIQCWVVGKLGIRAPVGRTGQLIFYTGGWMESRIWADAHNLDTTAIPALFDVRARDATQGRLVLRPAPILLLISGDSWTVE